MKRLLLILCLLFVPVLADSEQQVILKTHAFGME